MNKYLTLFLIIFSLLGCKNDKNHISKDEKTRISDTKNETNKPTFGIAIHGGAGTIKKENMTDSLEKAYRLKLEESIKVGHTILKNGGTALEAVTSTINVLEDSPLFNAGKGAVFTHDETNELDASIMDGATLNAGAVAGVKRIKNPINLALAVMNNSPHVLLYGTGAETFAKEQGFEFVDPAYFFTERRYKSMKKAKKRAAKKNKITFQELENFNDSFINDTKFGTVGCVALDKNGNLAAGTSTGGMTNKRWNRIGDSPIIGAGTYANNATCAISSTGWGEYFIRGVVAHDISAMMEYKGVSLDEAAKEVIQKKLIKMGGTGGVIAIDKNGNTSAQFNTAGMYRATMNAQGELHVLIFKEN